eukprot:CAMPEP_0115847088 /NCGR_PEP_ID=MMETSP0287-20121206/10199_1 /TAXON_ID=412157 /ORGANISM="Chrysochromulina rotalis, Strain UIO044" /LENGTH=87 /DNA_ID=CAMNT_0003300905 /DNA_START=343 /DNA_END=606 /DNA_ORIENTATION=-
MWVHIRAKHTSTQAMWRLGFDLLDAFQDGSKDDRQQVHDGLATAVRAERAREEDGQPLGRQNEGGLMKDEALKGGEDPTDDELVSGG